MVEVLKFFILAFLFYVTLYTFFEEKRIEFIPPILIIVVVCTLIYMVALDNLFPALRDGVILKPTYVEPTKTLYIEVDRFEVQDPLDIEHIEVVYKEKYKKKKE